MRGFLILIKMKNKDKKVLIYFQVNSCEIDRLANDYDNSYVYFYLFLSETYSKLWICLFSLEPVIGG